MGEGRDQRHVPLRLGGHAAFYIGKKRQKIAGKNGKLGKEMDSSEYPQLLLLRVGQSPARRPLDAANINSFPKHRSEKIIVTLTHVNECSQKGFTVCNEGVCTTPRRN